MYEPPVANHAHVANCITSVAFCLELPLCLRSGNVSGLTHLHVFAVAVFLKLQFVSVHHFKDGKQGSLNYSLIQNKPVFTVFS